MRLNTVSQKHSALKVFAFVISTFVILSHSTGCKETPKIDLTGTINQGTITPNTGTTSKPSLGRYIQSSISFPSLPLNDTLLLQASSWDSGISFLWGFNDINASTPYASLTLPSSEIVVAVIDTGIDKDHEDIAGRLWVNTIESTDSHYANKADDDGNGFIDDSIGWSFTDDTNYPIDDNGHGSHTSGTIGAIANNSKGIAGVAPWVRIMPLKVCDSGGSCSSSDIRAAMQYAIDNGAKIINLSLGSEDTGADADAFNVAVKDAHDAGLLVVVASGNSAIDTANMTPANATYAMAVAAYRSDSAVCSFSDWGWKLDIAAPGCALKSGFEGSGVLSMNSSKCGSSFNQICSTKNTVSTNYVLKSGTSMAAPHVAGLAAIAWTASPTATPLQIRQALIRSSRPKTSTQFHSDFGYGLASASNLISEAQTAPGIKITSPKYGTSNTSHSIDLRFENRSHALTWTLRYLTEPSTLAFGLTSGTTISTGNVSANTNVNSTVNWTPPSSGSYLVILEAIANGEKYYDITLLSK